MPCQVLELKIESLLSNSCATTFVMGIDILGLFFTSPIVHGNLSSVTSKSKSHRCLDIVKFMPKVAKGPTIRLWKTFCQPNHFWLVLWFRISAKLRFAWLTEFRSVQVHKVQLVKNKLEIPTSTGGDDLSDHIICPSRCQNIQSSTTIEKHVAHYRLILN